MYEFRIVADQIKMDLEGNQIYMHTNMCPYVCGYGIYDGIFNNLNTALKELQHAIDDVNKWQDKYNSNSAKDGYVIKWVNFHIEYRKVTGWFIYNMEGGEKDAKNGCR